MKSITIISPPPGQGPEWVRRQWVGLILPVHEKDVRGVQLGVHGGSPENLGGYPVKYQEARLALMKKSPKAARWWDQNLSPTFEGELVFRKEVCRLGEWSGWLPSTQNILDKLYADAKARTVEEKILVLEKRCGKANVSSAQGSVTRDQVLAVYEYEYLGSRNLIELTIVG